jgi:hypothetical protein
MEQSIGWGEWITVWAVLLACLVAFALIWIAVGREINWVAVGVVSAIVLILGLAYGLVLWVVPEALIRCQWIPSEFIHPAASPIPDDCTALDWIRDTVVIIVAFVLAVWFEVVVIAGVLWMRKRFRTPPDDS